MLLQKYQGQGSFDHSQQIGLCKFSVCLELAELRVHNIDCFLEGGFRPEGKEWGVGSVVVGSACGAPQIALNLSKTINQQDTGEYLNQRGA